MAKVLVVVDMQNDFITGPLGSKDAEAIVPKVADKIRGFDGIVITTQDTHGVDYLATNEGRHLPVPHCIDDTEGHAIHKDVMAALKERGQQLHNVRKHTFGTRWLGFMISDLAREQGIDSIELCGLCTDICVVSNAIMLKEAFPCVSISVDASCCAGVTKEKHAAALEVMRSCQIEVED